MSTVPPSRVGVPRVERVEQVVDAQPLLVGDAVLPHDAVVRVDRPDAVGVPVRDERHSWPSRAKRCAENGLPDARVVADRVLPHRFPGAGHLRHHAAGSVGEEQIAVVSASTLRGSRLSPP